MILPRSLYNDSPPERRSRIQNNPTLLYSWWCTIFALVIIGFRLSGRYIRNERLFREDKVMAWSIIPLLARMSVVHVVLIYGTNNVDIDGLTDPVKIRHREIGSKMVLAARIFYALFIWMAKFTVSEFLKRMTERFWKKGYELGLRCIRGFLVVTFIGVLIATLAECQPVTHYWQVIPDPGPQCRQGYAHLLTMGVTDIITDVLLICFPIPIIWRSSMALKRKLSLVSLFSMSTILIAITATRIPLVVQHRGLQQFRTVLASSEILAAAIVSNAIILGSFLRDRGVKKAKYKFGSTNESMERRSSSRRQTLQQWGSDEDLARSLGYRTNPELAEERTSIPRPAPVANLRLLSPSGQAAPFSDTQWQFPSSVSQDSDDPNLKAKAIEDPHPSPRGGRRVSFFDVGGLLEAGSHAGSVPSPTDSVLTHDFASQPRRGSRASNTLLPNGRSLQARRGSRLSQQSEDYEMTSVRPQQQLQDPGGLLSESHELAFERESSPSTSPPSNTPSAVASPLPAAAIRGPTQARHPSLPSLQDAGGLLDTSPSDLSK
ncbi:hypothetical protein K491DRAFT_701946 [Lophiostoma macrostomum CBS 122681]|uniref:Rhodopsin domain-containing protein n=1 Tax=Lophiostoma macrostomum CBS 122681 TaxID=1314788 RepID=A0A6A6TIS3_9PLEO|nr:hypothetical protein K491DRAFT_701946 [Lophiostoma macrostomum CBS 122681]